MHPGHLLLALLVAFLWGVNFVAVKIGLATIPPIFITALRFMLVVILLAPFLQKLDSRLQPHVRKLALVLGTAHFSLVFLGMGMGLNVASVVIACQMGVPFSCLLGTFLLKDYLGPWRSLGIFIAFIGLVIVAGTPNAAGHMGALLLVVAGAFAWGYSNILIKQMGKFQIMPLLAWLSLYSIPPLLMLSLLLEQGQWEAIKNITTMGAGSVFFSAVLSTIIGYGIWYWLLARHSVSQVIPFQLLVPVFGILASHFYLGEELEGKIWAGAALVILGVGIITLRRPKNVVAPE